MIFLEYTGMIFSIAGAILFSTKLIQIKKVRLTAFIIYFVANLSFVLFFFFKKEYGPLISNTIFLLTSINGIRNNI